MTIDDQTTIEDATDYRVIVVDRKKRGLIAVDLEQRLPRVRIPRRARRTRELSRAIESEFGLSTFIVDFVGNDDLSPCVIAEIDDSATSLHLEWTSLTGILRSELSEMERATAQLTFQDRSIHEVSKLGWVARATSWVEAKTGQSVVLKAGVEQFAAGRGFSLLRFRMEDGSEYWLKSTSAPHRHELPITRILSALARPYLPVIIAVNEDWNAWLTSGAGTEIDESLPEAKRFPALERAVIAMAEIQVGTIGRIAELRKAGAFDQRAGTLAMNSEVLFEYLEEAMGRQTSTRVAPIAKARLSEIRDIFEAICERLAKLALPDAIIHGDVNLGNILFEQDHCRFIDWSEAYVGTPFIVLQHLLLLNFANNQEEKMRTDRILTTRYRNVFARAWEIAAIDDALIFMPLLAAMSALYGRGASTLTQSPRLAHNYGYARTLARYMDRAARSPKLLEAIRPSLSRASIRISDSMPACPDFC